MIRGILSLAVSILVLCYSVESQRSCHMREMDLCITNALLSVQNGGLPTNQRDMQRMCKSLTDGQYCLGNYTARCSTPLQNELANFLIVGPNRFQKELCTRDSKLNEEFLRLAPCRNQASKASRHCMKDFQVALDKVVVTPFDKRIVAACCAFNRFRACGNEKMLEICGQELVDNNNEIIKSFASHLPEVICGPWNPESAECQKLIPPKGYQPPKGQKANSVLTRLLAAYVGA